MKLKKTLFYGFIVMTLLVTSVGVAFAEDGVIFRRNISKTPENETEKANIFMMDFYVPAQNADGTVLIEDEDEDTTGIEYYIPGDDPRTDETEEITLVETRYFAKPLISVWIDNHEVADTSLLNIDGLSSVQGGITFGEFDAYAGVSLDDGMTWKTTNISRSADLSSFTPTKLGVNQYIPYPGDVHNVVHQVFGDNILIAWVSKYCEGGTPLYSLSGKNLSVNEDYFADLEYDGSNVESDAVAFDKDPLYLYDLFGVSGNQGSVDYTEQGFPEIGEIPYSCVWTARGKLVAEDDPTTGDGTGTETDTVEATHVIWMKPERLTSGVRDANLPAVDCAGGAGCVLTWQEDPEGLRPGQGLGPGEGWSGAIANAQTDIWYSYIKAEDFDYILLEDEDVYVGIQSFEDYLAEYILEDADTSLQKPGVPMAMPVRLTDNAKCRIDTVKVDTTGILVNPAPYCVIDFDEYSLLWDQDVSTIQSFLEDLDDKVKLVNIEFEDSAVGITDADYCANVEKWTPPETASSQDDQTICVSEDNRLLNGRVASTRVRLNLKPYDSDGDELNDSAWLVMAAEESKALGDILIGDTDKDGVCDEGEDDCTGEPIDIGKDMWYYSFDPFEDKLMIDQGGLLNQPATCKYNIETDPLCVDAEGNQLEVGEDGVYPFYPVQIDNRGNEFYLSEIARRFAVTTNSVKAAMDSESGLSAMLIYKQGIINQGGPADIFLRRVVIPDDFDPAIDNPYAYENMECGSNGDGWIYPTLDSGAPNPNYLKGLCIAPAINISGSTIVDCRGATPDETIDTTDLDPDEICAAAFPVADDGSSDQEGDFPKVYEWRQLPYDGSATSIDAEGGVGIFDDTIDDVTTDTTDLDDQSWENPYDVAKGHRGFLDGDIVMMMYAWSPNWNSNAVGNDHYNLYVRRSFDGGLTWTTTPADVYNDSIPDGQGVQALDFYYGDSIGDPVPVVWDYAAGAAEQARNVSLLNGNKVTILDPRYTPTGGLKMYSSISTDWLDSHDFSAIGYTSESFTGYTDDLVRDPSKFFVVYETGDNTTVAEGEAIPLDLYYSRGTVFGDVYEWYDYLNDDSDGYIDNDNDGIPDEFIIDPTVELRWPWLENQTDDLSGEAGVVANPGGTFMYAVWNQWREQLLPDGEELVYDSDIWFRRLFYLPDDSELATAPVASLLYVSGEILIVDEDDVLTILVTATDADNVGEGEDIVAYEWSVDGIPLDDDAHLCEMQKCQIPARVLSEGWSGFSQVGAGGTGWHTIQVKAMDNDGHYSNVIMHKAYVAQTAADVHPYTVNIPLIQR